MEPELLACLAGGLSAEHAQRHAAEQRLQALSASAGYAVGLAQIAAQPAHPEAARQLALLVLKGFVRGDGGGGGGGGGWAGGGVAPDEQAAVRGLLLALAADPAPRLRTAAGAVIGRLARAEWPERWPELLPRLAEHVQSGAPERMAGGMRCIHIFADDIADEQLPLALPALWPTLLQVMGAAGAAHQRLRARAMATAHSLLTMLSNCVGAGVAGAAELLDQVLPPLLEACLAVLGEAAGEGGATHGVQLHTLKTVSMLLQAFPKRMSGALGALLPAVMALLASGLAAFEAREVRGAAAGGTAADEAYDSDGTPVGFEDCVAQLVELVGALVEVPRFRKAVR